MPVLLSLCCHVSTQKGIISAPVGLQTPEYSRLTSSVVFFIIYLARIPHLPILNPNSFFYAFFHQAHHLFIPVKPLN